LSADTIAALDRLLPQGWSRANPVDIVVDADGERYATAIEALLRDPGVDALLVINVPTALASSAEAATARSSTRTRLAGKGADKPVYADWLGPDEQAKEGMDAAGIPGQASEADADDGLLRHW